MRRGNWIDRLHAIRYKLCRGTGSRNAFQKKPPVSSDCLCAFGHAPRPARGPIFIGGTGRSGTTVLARLLGQHPNLFIHRWETQLIVAPDGLLDLLGDLGSSEALDVFLRKLRGPWFQRVLYKGKPNEYTAGLCADFSWEEMAPVIALFENLVRLGGGRLDSQRLGAEFLDALFVPGMRRAGAHRWGEKTPRNLFFIESLWHLFPEMRFVHIIRDGRDVVASLLENGFWPIAPSPAYPSSLPFRGPMTFEKAVDYWVEMLRIGRRSAEKVPEENYLEIRLEDLVTHRIPTLERLMAFLGEPLTEELRAFDLSRSRAGRWKEELSPKQLDYFYERAGAVLAREGYTR